MRRELIGAVSAIAFMTGAAFAQDASGTAQPGAAATAPAATAQPGAQATGGAVTAASVEEMLGKDVYGADGEELGSVEDVILDPQTGQAQQLVIASGGFLGIGAKNIAVDFEQAQLQQEGDEARIVVQNLTQAQVENMPEFEYDQTMTSLNRQRDGGTNTGAGGAQRAPQ